MFRANKKRKYKNLKNYKGKKNRVLFKLHQVLFQIINYYRNTIDRRTLIPILQHRTRFHQNAFITNNTNNDKSTIRRFGQYQHQRNITHKQNQLKAHKQFEQKKETIMHLN